MKKILVAISFLLLAEYASAGLIQLEKMDGAVLENQYRRHITTPKYDSILSLLHKNEFQKAREEAILKVSQYPKEFSAHLLLILAYVATNDYSGIQKHLNEVAIQIPSYSIPLRENLFSTYKNYNRYFRALEAIKGVDYKLLSPEVLSSAGEIYLAQGKYNEAETALKESVAKTGGIGNDKLELARVYYVLREFAKAQSLLTDLSIEQSGNPKILQLAAASSLAAGDLTSAKNFYDQILSINKKDFLANLNAGVIALVRGDNTYAVERLNDAVLADAESADAWVALYIAQSRLGQPTNALTNAPKTVQKDSGFALAQLASGKLDDATIDNASNIIPDLKYLLHGDARQSFSNHNPLDLVYVSLLYHLGYYDAVVSHMDDKNKPVTKSDLQQLILARTYTKQGKEDLSNNQYQLLKKANGEMVSPYLELAELKYRQRDFTGAIQEYKAVLLKHPDRVDWLFQLSSLYSEAGLSGEAISTLENAKRLQSNPLIDNQIAAIYSEVMNDQDKAISLGTQALQQYPSAYILYDTVAWAYHQKGAYAKAAEYYEKLVKETGSNHSPQTFYRIGLTYEKLNSGNPSLYYELAMNAGSKFQGRDHAIKYLSDQ